MEDISNNLNDSSSQISHTQLLFKSVWSEFGLNGQLSKEQIQNCCWNKSDLILFESTEQSLFSRVIIHTKFFTPSQSISSSQISGIPSPSWSHLYLDNFQSFKSCKQTSTEFICTVHWFVKATHLFTSTEFVNILSQAVRYA